VDSLGEGVGGQGQKFSGGRGEEGGVVAGTEDEGRRDWGQGVTKPPDQAELPEPVKFPVAILGFAHGTTRSISSP
jgi:hypothetical protein